MIFGCSMSINKGHFFFRFKCFVCVCVCILVFVYLIKEKWNKICNINVYLSNSSCISSSFLFIIVDTILFGIENLLTTRASLYIAPFPIVCLVKCFWPWILPYLMLRLWSFISFCLHLLSVCLPFLYFSLFFLSAPRQVLTTGLSGNSPSFIFNLSWLLRFRCLFYMPYTWWVLFCDSTWKSTVIPLCPWGPHPWIQPTADQIHGLKFSFNRRIQPIYISWYDKYFWS